MGIILVLVGIAVLAFWADKRLFSSDSILGCVAIITVVLLSVAILFMPFVRLDCRTKIVAIEATRSTLEFARERGVLPLELAAIQKDVIEANRTLAVLRFYAKSFWTWGYVPKSVLDVKPIK